MKKTLSLLLLLVLILSACSSAPTVTVEPTNPPRTGGLPQTEADVSRVTVEQALTALNSGAAVIVDVRSAESFFTKHILGALSIPLNQIEDDPQSVPLDKDRWIITYCT